MKKTKRIFILMLLMAPIFPIWAQQVQIVNMIPNAQSNETAQDREPNLAINSATPNQLVGTAFTPNPLGATTPPSAPIFFSQDGGQTWVLNSIVPSNISTGDITSKFGTTTNWLYTGILRIPAATGATLTMDIFRTNNVAGTALMPQLQTRNSPDQPYAYAATPPDGIDRMYVGNNDLGILPRSAAVDLSLNASATTPTLSTAVIERRTPTGQDGPPVRLAIHPEGTLYAIHVQRTATSGTLRTANIVVTRDDNWGTGTNPFSDLTDPGDGLAGRIVVTGIQFTFSGNNISLGQERTGDRVAIAVDPNNDRSVYVAWVDNTGTGTNNIHIRRSTDSGANWSANDLYAVNNAINPDIAVNSQGEVAFSYQQLAGGNWSSIIERTTNDFANRTTNVLNTFPDNTPAGGTFFPYLGDYAYLTTMPSGKNFVGVFSASNDPTPARFPTVQPAWQRNLNTTTNQLRNLANTANVAISIDPYFYRVDPVAINNDFYVRDWTKTPTDNDPGAEPSTEPVFYLTSDVWNRRLDTPGTFNSNDQPQSMNPRPMTAGGNFAYARVHRRATGPAANANLLFLKSEFGTGSNYQLINGVSSFASLAFSATDQQKTMAAGVAWNLIDPAAVTANHVCMAVEIAGPNDPSANPTLLGRAPGWSNGTDLLVLADNNKAQRNLEVYTGTADSGESLIVYAIAHNATFFERDMVIYINPHGKVPEREKYRISVIGGGEGSENAIQQDSLVLKNMKPCENRWIELMVSTFPAAGAEPVSYLFEERVNHMRINGFGIDVQSGKLEVAGEENLGEHAFAFQRLEKEYNIADAGVQASKALDILDGTVDEPTYTSFLQDLGPAAIQLIRDFVSTQGSDPFGVVNAANTLENRIQGGDWKKAATVHGNLMRKCNAFLSYLDKLNGDTADILQTVRWFRDVVKRGNKFSHSELADKTIAAADKFILQYSNRELMNSDYPAFVSENLNVWVEMLHKQLPNDNFDNYISAIRQNIRDPKRLQKSHCELVNGLVQKAGL